MVCLKTSQEKKPVNLTAKQLFNPGEWSSNDQWTQSEPPCYPTNRKKKEKEKRATLFLISYGVYSLHLISITPSSYYLELKKYTIPLKQAEPSAE